MMMGREIIDVLFGSQWGATVVPFQILCLAGMLKLLNSFVSSATQAKGRIWPEVWRQVAYASLIAIGVVIGSRWGIKGAAIGVLAATTVMAALMQDLMRRTAGLAWRELLAPQGAAIACSIVVAATVPLTAWAVTRALPGAPTVVLLGAEGLMAGGAYLLFLLFAPFTDVRALVAETVEEFLPKWQPAFERLVGRPPVAAPAVKAVHNADSVSRAAG
jgi:O-antigen/teichoic acid export membrane protein